MYATDQTRAWSISHLKAGCWYIECMKTICPIEEEDVKAACDKADSKDPAPGTNEGDEQENEAGEVKTKAAAKKKKGGDKAEKTKETVKKVGKKGEKSGKEKSSSPPPLLTEASTVTPSEIPRKQDASTAELSMSRLQ